MSVLGVDIGGTKIAAGNVLKSVLQNYVEKETQAKESAEHILENLYSAIEKVISPDTKAIGIGIPGFIDSMEGIVLVSNHLQAWNGLNLREKVENRFQLEVCIENDANCFAKGVQMYGAGKGYSHIAGITLGTGLGMGLILNNQIYNGVMNGAGEFGQIPYRDGKLEDYCSGKFFEDQGVAGEIIYNLALQGDANALILWNNFGQHIGHLLTMVLYSLAPEIVVFGGSVSKGYPFFIQSIYEMLDHLKIHNVADKFQILCDNNSHSGIFGAAAICKHNA